MDGPEKVVGLQCIDTLKTITVDSDVAKRFMIFLPEIVQMIVGLIATVNIPQFFEFVQEFGKFYSRVMNDEILFIFKALVDRVLAEQSHRDRSSDSANIRIGKCMNVIRMIIEKQEYIKKFPEILEENLKPLYIFMADPRAITFDEDIIIILKSFIKASHSVTQTQWEIYQKFPLVLEKQKHQFGNMIESINYFCTNGKNDML